MFTFRFHYEGLKQCRPFSVAVLFNYIILNGLGLIKDDNARAQKNTARVEDECSILLGQGDFICYQPKKKTSNIVIIFHPKADLTKICPFVDQIK